MLNGHGGTIYKIWTAGNTKDNQAYFLQKLCMGRRVRGGGKTERTFYRIKKDWRDTSGSGNVYNLFRLWYKLNN